MSQDQLRLAVLKYIRNFWQTEAQDNESIEVALQCLESGFGVDALSEEARKEAEIEFPLEDVFRLGLQALRLTKKQHEKKVDNHTESPETHSSAPKFADVEAGERVVGVPLFLLSSNSQYLFLLVVMCGWTW